VRPVRIGETWRRATTKCILLVAGKDTKESCGIDQLCAGLEARVTPCSTCGTDTSTWKQNGAFYSLMRALHLMRGIELVCCGQFNTSDSGARFTFNCYRHWSILMIRGNNGTGVSLHSKEGVIQREPLAMFVYHIWLWHHSPTHRQLKEDFPDVEQP
jgi:hypothetical protein